MPADIKDQEGMFPFHHDTLYDPSNDQGHKVHDVEDRIQAISREMTGIPISKDGMTRLQSHLESKGLSVRNVGDSELEKEIRSFINKISSSKKVIQAYVRLQQNTF